MSSLAFEVPSSYSLCKTEGMLVNLCYLKKGYNVHIERHGAIYQQYDANIPRILGKLSVEVM